ncbi:MAG: GGDEF domain-containing protein [Gammaproteobacteria bacterium]
MPDSKRIMTEQVRLLYKRAPAVIPINIVIASILTVMLLPVVSAVKILTWLAVMTIWCITRFIFFKIILNKGDFETDPKRLIDIFAISVFVTGILWVSVFIGFAFTIPDVYIVFIIFSLGGMSVGAVASMVSVPLVFFSYISPMIIPPTIVFLFQGNALGFAMSSMMLIYYISISSTYMQSHRLATESIQLQIDKDELIQNLKHTNQNLEIANDKVLALSNTDELTQLSNRRQLDVVLAKEWGRAVRSQLPIAFIMFDLDFFKDYNDTFGHQQGDECLKKVSAVLRQTFKRPGDCVARYGGEEFAAILPDTTLEGAVKMAQHVLAALVALRIPAANTKASAFVSMSAGVACMVPFQDDEMVHLVSKADAALYRAKQAGRNRLEQDETASIVQGTEEGE